MSGAWAWYKVDGSEAPPTFTWSSASDAQTTVMLFKGLNATPVGNFVQALGSGVSATTTTLTSTSDNSLLLDIIVTDVGGYTIDAITNRTKIDSQGGVGTYSFDTGNINVSGTVTDTATYTIQSSDWIAFSVEIKGTGAGTDSGENVSQIVALVPETYSDPILTSHASSTVLEVPELYVDPILGCNASQICITILRTVSIGPPPTGPTGVPITEPNLCVICDDSAGYTTLPPWLYNFKQITRG
jgi:hypothetical protein